MRRPDRSSPGSSADSSASPTSRPSPLPAKVFDLAEALEGVDGRYDRLQRIIEFYFGEAPLLLAQMRAGLQSENASAIARAAHRLAGTLVYLKAPPALAAARRVDDLGVAGDLKDVAEAISALERELAVLSRDLVPHRVEMQPHA